MAGRTGSVISRNSRAVWLGDRGTYPVLAALGFGVVFASYTSYRTLVYNPDVHFDRSYRSQPVRPDDRSEQDWWLKHQKKWSYGADKNQRLASIGLHSQTPGRQ